MVTASRWQIAKYWQEEFELYLDSPACFACKWDSLNKLSATDNLLESERRWNRCGLDIAHILSRHDGGLALPVNLVLLCRRCHKDAPMVIHRAAMLDFIKTREYFPITWINRLVSECARIGAVPPSTKEDLQKLLALARHLKFAGHPNLTGGELCFAGNYVLRVGPT